MTRSEINGAIELASGFFRRQGIVLPAWAGWTPADWAGKGPECQEIRDTRIGWDVTDFGSGDFRRIGRIIFTLRNGSARMSERYPKAYAHKVMCMLEEQKSPIHYHRSKREDICCFAGGAVAIRLWRAAADHTLSREAFAVSVDGIRQEIAAGATLILEPGQSVCVEPRTYHQFWAQAGRGTTVTFEVSSTCNDLDDNFWLERQERFPPVSEDEPSRHVLCGEYPPAAETAGETACAKDQGTVP